MPLSHSNTQGGRIIIGVNDDRRIVGLNEDPFLVRDRAIDIISNGCEPRIFPNSYITTIDGRDLVIIMIEAGADRPYHIKGENPEFSAYVRTSASNRLPSSGMLKELELEGARRSFDSLDHLGDAGDVQDLAEGLYREDTPEIPVEAVREFVINALEHRSYAMESNPVFVAVFDDRVEITLPGMLPQGFSMDKVLSGLSNPRNEVIARFFREAKLTEGWGSGLIRAMNLCTVHGLKTPCIEELDDFVRVTIYRQDVGAPSTDNNPARSVLPLSDTELMILDIIRNNPEIKISEIAQSIGKQVPATKKYIAKLKSIGILMRSGSKQNSVWSVTDHIKEN